MESEFFDFQGVIPKTELAKFIRGVYDLCCEKLDYLSSDFDYNVVFSITINGDGKWKKEETGEITADCSICSEYALEFICLDTNETIFHSELGTLEYLNHETGPFSD